MRTKNLVKITKRLVKDSNVILRVNVENVYFSLMQQKHALKPIVEVGEEVVLGQILATDENGNAKIISTVNGSVKSIQEREQENKKHAFVIEIVTNKKEEKLLSKLRNPGKDKIINRLVEAGIYNLPLKSEVYINTFEPKLSVGLNNVLLSNYTNQFVKAIKLLSKVNKQITILLNAEHKESSLILKELAKQNANDIKVLFKNKVPKEVVEVKNLQDIIALYNAVYLGKYYDTKVVAVGGLSIKHPSFYEFKIGTSITEVIELTGGLRHTYEEIEQYKDQASIAIQDQMLIKQDIKNAKTPEEKEKYKEILKKKKQEANKLIFNDFESQKEKFLLCLKDMAILSIKKQSARSVTNSIKNSTNALMFLSRKELK